MYNDLIMMTFSRQEEAYLAWSGLDMMRDWQMMGVDKAAAIKRDISGRTTFHQSWEIGVYPNPKETQILRNLADAIFNDVNPQGQATLIDAGLDPGFLKNVVSALGPDSSALLFYVPRESLIDTERLLDSLTKMRGTVHHTTFTTAVSDAILNQEWLSEGANL